MNKKLTKIVGATLGLAMAVGVGVGFSNNSKVTRLYADNDISISENTTGTSYSGTFFDISAGGATNSGYYKLGSATFTSKSSYSIDSTKSISYSITTRKFGGPSSAEAVVNLSLVNGSNTVATASYSPSSTTLTAYSGTFSVTGDTSSVKFVIKGNGTDTGSKGVGISAISFTATSAGGAVITKYSVTYHANNSDGGTVPSDDGEYLTGDSVVVAGNSGSLVRTGYTWAGWSLNEDGSGTAYGPAYTSNYAVSVGDVDFYPIWKAPLPSSGTISITGSHPTIGSYGDDVPYLVEEDNTPNSSFAFKCTQVMKNNDDLQFKKTDGVLYSTTPLPYLRSVSVSGTNNGDAVIKYGTSPDSGCTQDSIGTRNTFFKIANSASQARYWTITIVYSLEDPASLTDIVITDGADSVKKVYDDGEAFDPTGLVIKAKWGIIMIQHKRTMFCCSFLCLQYTDYQFVIPPPKRQKKL